MTRAQAVALIGLVKAAFPRADFSPATVSVYADQLQDLDISVARQAVDALIASSEWPPTIAAIRNKAADIIIGAPTVTEAFALAETSAPNMPPIVRAAKNLVGDSWFWQTEQRYKLHRMFRDAYDDALHIERRALVERQQHSAIEAQPALQAAPEPEEDISHEERATMLKQLREFSERFGR